MPTEPVDIDDQYSNNSVDNWSDTQNRSSSKDDEDKDYKRLLISLGMVLPAIAAIIGVVAWAISAEVVMGAKREAARRQIETNHKLHNRFDYTRYTNSPLNSLPVKEMLVDDHLYKDYADNRQDENLDIIYQHMQELSKDFLSKRNDDVDSSNLESTDDIPKLNQSHRLLNENLKSTLTQQNVAHLLEKLLNNHRSQVQNSKNPKIIVVAPIASQSKNVSKLFTETKVIPTKPKSFNLKMATKAPTKQERPSAKNNPNQTASKRKLTKPPQGATKKKSNTGSVQKKKVSTSVESSTSSTTKANGKNIKTKIYEKEIDLLLQKIEKLETQQKVHSDVSKSNKSSTTKQTNKKSSDISQKIKNFMSSEAIDKPEDKEMEFGSWQPSQNGPPFPMPPPPPPLPFMPFMPPMAPYPQFVPTPTSEYPYPGNLENAYLPPNHENPPQDHMQMAPSYDHFKVNSNMPPQMNQGTPNNNGHHQAYPNNFQGNSYNPNMAYHNQINNDQQNNQQFPINSQPQEEEEEPPKKSKFSFFRKKFKLSNIFNSVLPKSKVKNEEPTSNPNSDNRNIHVPPPLEQLITQESHMQQNVDRGNGGYYYEQPGSQMSIGGGPMGGGGQFKLSPMGILKTIMLPLLPKPRMNLNGKVVFGVVLENGVGFGKKPKTVFQHFSTGRIRR